MDANGQKFKINNFKQTPAAGLALAQKVSTDRWVSRAGSAFEALIRPFADYLEFDLGYRPSTATKYAESLRWVLRDLPWIIRPEDLKPVDIVELKKKMRMRGAGEARVNSVLFPLRKFLTYCNEAHGLVTIEPRDIKAMKIPKRQVVFLSKEEVQKLLSSINGKTVFEARIKALMSVLLASGMRISEALSLNKDDIDWERKEAVIIGKGNKQRTVYFDDDALGWMRAYLLKRDDKNEALFVTFRNIPQRMKPYDLSKQFKHYAQKAGIKKKLTPHILRHTMATIMSINGADIRLIQQILGHSDIETTAKYYLGVDQQAVKDAHAKFLKYN